jgi:hypothetical protein
MIMQAPFMAPMTPARLSGIQKDVLVLYRKLLRTVMAHNVRHNPGVTLPKSPLYHVVREKFREKAHSIGNKEYQMIEHLLRHGYKQQV